MIRCVVNVELAWLVSTDFFGQSALTVADMSANNLLTFAFCSHWWRMSGGALRRTKKRAGAATPARPTERTDQGSLDDHVNERRIRDYVHIKHFRELRKRATWPPLRSQVVAALRVCDWRRSGRKPLNENVKHKLGTQVPIPSKAMKGWLFQQGWLVSAVDRLLHPLRWTSISKGQVWNPPPRATWRHQLHGHIVRSPNGHVLQPTSWARRQRQK